MYIRILVWQPKDKDSDGCGVGEVGYVANRTDIQTQDKRIPAK